MEWKKSWISSASDAKSRISSPPQNSSSSATPVSAI
ncbi:hypothetical protein A2U01_0069013, partial [Trifolium medium]|nr:hypothetical protein [Trifolium medium]